MSAPPPKTQRQKAERETNSRRRLISAAIPADSPPTNQGPGKRKNPYSQYQARQAASQPYFGLKLSRPLE